MHIISSTDPWDLTTRQIDIGLLVSATNTASSSTGSASIQINGQTVVTGLTVANQAASNEVLNPYGADYASLTIHSIYANITKNDAAQGSITIRVTADEGSADLLWCYAHSNSIQYVRTVNGAIEYGPRGNTLPRVDPSLGNVDISPAGGVGNVDLGYTWQTIPSGGSAIASITGILGNIG
jgi:hypothetical protein